ncbi:lipocalin family protein [Longimicrobium sp.]|jgi:hypothetical protein|uniref:lipocalin family protein n=1 Tax=Longimicrobium sp. TaxID=2029185 RepID=UPI002EDB3264
MLRGRFLIAMLIALAATLAGCGDPAGSDGITGEYTLRTVNGTAVPATLDPMTSIQAGSLELRRGGRFSFTIESSVPGSGPIPDRRVTTEEGTYTSSGSTISLFYEDVDANAVPVTGVVSGNTLTLAMPFGGAWVFVR